MYAGSSTVPNLQVKSWSDDGRTFRKWQIYSMACSAKSFRAVTNIYNLCIN